MHQDEHNIKQPFLPRVGMIWFFITVSMVAIALGIIRAAEQGRALAAAIVVAGVFAVAVSLMSGLCFFVAFLFGASEKRLSASPEEAASPFANYPMPEQIIPPRAVDIN